MKFNKPMVGNRRWKYIIYSDTRNKVTMGAPSRPKETVVKDIGTLVVGVVVYKKVLLVAC